MIKNYFKTSIRSLLRNKGFTIINISGLTIGMAAAILILLWVQNELSYDRFHANGSRLYQVYSNNEINHSIRSITATPEIMAPILKADVPEIDEASRVTWQQFHILNVDDKNFRPLGCIVDEPFLQMFSFPLLEGNVQSALSDPYSIVLTEGLARKIFGNVDVMGKIIKMDNSDNMKVTGILKDLPNNTLFNFEYLTSYEYNSAKHYVDSDWTDISIATFVMLKLNTSLQTANEKMKDIIPHHSGGNSKTAEFLYPVEKLRLYSNFENGKVVGGRIERVRVFFIIGLFILIVACINFMNLSTARSEKRAREVGVRKVIGAKRNSLVFQFLSESILITLAAAIVALLIVQLSLPAFNQLVQERLFIDYGNPYFWLACIGFILFTGFLAGSYPAFLSSSFKPVSVLKGSFKHTSSSWNPRKILVVLQFTFAIVLIISTIVVEQQVKYAQERETGYDKNNLVYVFIQGDIGKNYSLIKNELLSSQVAASVTMGQAPLTQNWSSGISMNWQGKDPNAKIQINRYTEDGNLIKTAGMHLVEGRDIDIKNYPSDSTACLISESAVKAMGFKNPIGQIIFDDPVNWHVVGVIEDFILESPYEPIKPFMVKGPKYGGNVLLIRLNNSNNHSEELANAAKIFRKYNPAYPFEYYFSDEEYAKKFADEQFTGKLASIFAGLTIFISCLGLFGLATYVAESRTREIGVRKVLGASVVGIATLMSKDFVKLVVISILVATPVAWWSINKWLSGFAYRITISWWIFISAGAIAVIIALATISFQAIKAAIANPVISLRTE